MKRIISVFLATLFVSAVFSAVPVLAVDSSGIWYEKCGNEVVVTVKGIEETEAIFLMGCYQNNKMVSSSVCDIKDHDGTYSSKCTLEDNYEYKFFVWESRDNPRPLFDALTLTSATVDGVGNATPVASSKASGKIINAYAISLAADEINDCGINEIEVETRSGSMYFNISNLYINIEDYLGRSVDIYYDNISGENYVERIEFQQGKNETHKVMLNYSINSIDYYTSSVIEYYYNDTDRAPTKINVSSSASVLLNYQPTGDTIDVVLDENIENIGYITAVCSGSDSIADVIFVNTFDTVIVKSVENNIIYARNTEEIYELDINNALKDISIKHNGIDYPLSSICRDDVLSICASPDGKYTRVLVSNGKVEGFISEVRTNGVYVIDGEEYIYSPVYYGIYGNNSIPKVGGTISAVLDSFGFITYIIPDEELYATQIQPISVVKSIGSALDSEDNEVYTYIFVSEGETRTAYISHSIAEADSNLDETDTGRMDIGDAFWYKLNDNGEICELTVIFDWSAGTLTPTAAALTVESDGVAFVYGAFTEVNNGMAFAQGFESEYSYYGEILEMKYANVSGVTYAVVDDTMSLRNTVRVITPQDLQRTTGYSTVYAGLVKVSPKGRAEDVVQYIFTDSSLKSWESIDDVINEKLTYK